MLWSGATVLRAEAGLRVGSESLTSKTGKGHASRHSLANLAAVRKFCLWIPNTQPCPGKAGP